MSRVHFALSFPPQTRIREEIKSHLGCLMSLIPVCWINKLTTHFVHQILLTRHDQKVCNVLRWHNWHRTVIKFWLICSLDLYTHNKLVTLQLNRFNWVHWLDDCAIHTKYKPSTTFPSESVLQAFISPDELSAVYISKQYWKEVRWGELKSCQFNITVHILSCF